jgi:hypothetical protein
LYKLHGVSHNLYGPSEEMFDLDGKCYRRKYHIEGVEYPRMNCDFLEHKTRYLLKQIEPIAQELDNRDYSIYDPNILTIIKSFL